MINASESFIKAMKASVKQLFIKMEIYDSQNQFIKEITKSVTKDDIGSISVDTSRPIRRSFSFSLINNNNEFDWGDDKTIWLDKRIKLFIGLKLSDGAIEYVPQGVFVLTEPQDSHTLEGKKATIQGQDLMFLLTDRRGKFLNQTTIPTNTNISSAIQTIVSAAGITFYNFDSISDVTPYEITYSPLDNRFKAIDELAKLAKCDIYFDVYGALRLRKIDLNEFDTFPSEWSYIYGDPNERFYAGNVRKLEDTIVNHVVAYGGSSQTATQSYELKVTESDPLWAGSPYTIEKIGDLLYAHENGNVDPLLGGATNDAAKWRCKYELMQRLSLSERVSLQISPNYLHDANTIIQIEDASVTGKYLITSFSLPINPQLMTIECLKYKKIITDWDFI